MRKNFLGRGNDPFVCMHCSTTVVPLTSGSYRNHCPQCLHSQHVDVIPGDRANSCKGLMAPIAVDYSTKKGWIIVHRCIDCGVASRNKAALAGAQPDDMNSIIALASSL